MSKRYDPPPSPYGMSEREMLTQLYDRILGDGTENNPGLTTRVDRLEQKVGWIWWGVTSVVALVITTIGGWLFGLIGGKK